VTCALVREHLAAVAAALADTGVKLAPSAYLFSTIPRIRNRGTPTGRATASRTWRPRPESSSTSRPSATIPPASSSPPGSTWATPPPGSATAAAGRPPCGTTQTQYPKLTDAPRRTCLASPQTPPQRPRHDGNSSSSRLEAQTLPAELVVPCIAQSDLLPSCALFRSRRRTPGHHPQNPPSVRPLPVWTGWMLPHCPRVRLAGQPTPPS